MDANGKRDMVCAVTSAASRGQRLKQLARGCNTAEHSISEPLRPVQPSDGERLDQICTINELQCPTADKLCTSSCGSHLRVKSLPSFFSSACRDRKPGGNMPSAQGTFLADKQRGAWDGSSCVLHQLPALLPLWTSPPAATTWLARTCGTHGMAHMACSQNTACPPCLPARRAWCST